MSELNPVHLQVQIAELKAENDYLRERNLTLAITIQNMGQQIVDMQSQQAAAADPLVALQKRITQAKEAPAEPLGELPVAEPG